MFGDLIRIGGVLLVRLNTTPKQCGRTIITGRPRDNRGVNKTSSSVFEVTFDESTTTNAHFPKPTFIITDYIMCYLGRGVHLHIWRCVGNGGGGGGLFWCVCIRWLDFQYFSNAASIASSKHYRERIKLTRSEQISFVVSTIIKKKNNLIRLPKRKKKQYNQRWLWFVID